MIKKNKKKKVIIISIILITIIVCIALYLSFLHPNNNNLTLEENKWLDSNKYDVVDVALINNLPILSNNGDGLIYDYLSYVTNDTSLKFNIIPFKIGDTIDYEYKLDVSDSYSKDDIVLFKDNFILITNNNFKYSDINKIENLKLGILDSDVTMFENYFSNKNIEFIKYESYSALKEQISKEKQNIEDNIANTIDGILIPKIIFTEELIKNDYKISYIFDNLNKYVVLKTAGNTNLNSILRKKYNIWSSENYKASYNKNLLNNYFTFKNISDLDIKKLQSKKYSYGFIDYGLYNYIDKKKINGITSLILKDFNEFSNLTINYTRYNSISTMIKDFESNKIDFILNTINYSDNNFYKTVGIYNKKVAIISGNLNKEVITNMASLKDKVVLNVKDSNLEDYLTVNKAKVKSYNNIKDLLDDFDSDDIAIIDFDNYDFYSSTLLKNAKINFIYNTDEQYNFLINNSNDNEIFKNLFDFYLNYNSIEELKISNYDDILMDGINITYILIVIIIILCIYVVLDFTNHIKHMIKMSKKNKKIKLSKEEKIKYIDQLTSLKNRAYLNSKIESWDDSEIYPQSIIIVDLNNISYINDNYGREEGDKVITEAANILIQHQLQNSEIIRTDGNEFLIYLVGYDEKQVISYLRKLNKEFKNLSHGFGAASGYSIINDAIKTVDDAVNEATLDMKNNKEDIEY